MQYAIVKNGTVQNVIELDEGASFPVDGELVAATSDTKMGGSWDGNVFTFVEPTPPEPTAEELAEQAKRDSAKLKLEGLGLTIDEIQAAFGI